jgi:hypothetical protein
MTTIKKIAQLAHNFKKKITKTLKKTNKKD